jgi:hypothetical protein
MPLIVIGGHSRGVGKTSVVAGLITALPEYNWMAVKISQHGHGAHAAEDHNWAISEEQDRLGNSDTSRFLAAGASHAWWVRSEPGCLAEAMPAVRRFASRVVIRANARVPTLWRISRKCKLRDKDAAADLRGRLESPIVKNSYR